VRARVRLQQRRLHVDGAVDQEYITVEASVCDADERRDKVRVRHRGLDECEILAVFSAEDEDRADVIADAAVDEGDRGCIAGEEDNISICGGNRAIVDSKVGATQLQRLCQPQ